MRHYLINREISKARKRELEKYRKKIDRIAAHDLTFENKIEDFSEIQKYLASRFSQIDISDIKIYVADPEVVNKEGWKHAGGCYIDVLKVILVKNKIENPTVRGKFNKMMQESSFMEVEVEDVVIHELIHAISHRMNRASSRFSHMEEEFVYTNCLDFYKQKGMTEDDIVNNNFLPFCVQDVYSSEMSDVWKSINKTSSEIREISADQRKYTALLNRHAEIIVPLIIKKAKEKAYRMIEMYHKYGSEMYQTSDEVIKDSSSLRFSNLDLD